MLSFVFCKQCTIINLNLNLVLLCWPLKKHGSKSVLVFTFESSVQGYIRFLATPLYFKFPIVWLTNNCLQCNNKHGICLLLNLAQIFVQKKPFKFVFGGQFHLNAHKSNVRNVYKCLPIMHVFIENGSQRCISISADVKEPYL